MRLKQSSRSRLYVDLIFVLGLECECLPAEYAPCGIAKDML